MFNLKRARQHYPLIHVLFLTIFPTLMVVESIASNSFLVGVFASLLVLVG